MSEATFVRFFDEDLEFINKVAREKNAKKSHIIKEIVHSAIKKLKLNEAIRKYDEGHASIREASKLAGLDYDDFFNELCKKGLIGKATKEEEDRMINVLVK